MVLEQRHSHGQRARSETEGALDELGFADDAAFESERPSLTLAQRREYQLYRQYDYVG